MNHHNSLTSGQHRQRGQRVLTAALLACASLFLDVGVGRALAQSQQSAFSWSMQNDDHGRLPRQSAPLGHDWESVEGGGIRFREVPSWTGDPTYQVYFHPYFSGSPDLAERILLQVPKDWASQPLGERALVVGFHGFSVSEKDVFLNSDLPFECSRRGWMLMAPYGLTDLSFGNAPSQTALDQVLRTIHRHLQFNHRRIYTVGFSMGGVGALSYAMRHQDPLGPRVAGVVFHTGPLDLLQTHREGTLKTRMILEHPLVFDGSPRENPFAYTRISPALMTLQGQVDASHTPVLHLKQVPVYLHANLADPSASLVNGVLELDRFLSEQGASVTTSLIHDVDGGHRWTTMDMSAALDQVGASSLGGVPDSLEVVADRVASYGPVGVHALPYETHAQFEWTRLGAGRDFDCAIDDCLNLEHLRVDTALAGLDPREVLTLRWSSVDGTSDTLTLSGYDTQPSAIYVDGERLDGRGFRFNRLSNELTLYMAGSDRGGPLMRSVRVEP